MASQRAILPRDAEDPVIDSNSGSFPLMFLAFYSETMSPVQITDFLLRGVIPKLQAVPGVAKAEIRGDQTFAMRIWLDPERMAALGVTASDVRDALQNNNYLSGVGQTKGDHVSINLSASTDISREEDFEKLIIRSEGDTLVLTWGSTYGAATTAVQAARAEGRSVAHAHLRYLNPLPRNLGDVVRRYRRVLMPENNLGQLRMLIRAQFLVDAQGVNKVSGQPFSSVEILDAILAE